MLNRNEIDHLCRSEVKLISNFNPMNLNTVSYDMTLGDECYISDFKKAGSYKIIHLHEKEEVCLPPYSILLFHTFEEVNIPNGIVSRISLKMSHIQNGLILPNQPLIEPGYDNNVFGLLYNLSDKEIILRKRERIVSIEFHKINKIDDQELYKGEFDTYGFLDFIGKEPSSSLRKLNMRLEKSKKHVKRLNKLILGAGAAIAILIAAASLAFSIQSSSYDRSYVTEMKGTQEYIDSLEERINELESGKLEKLEEQLDDLESEMNAFFDGN